MKSEIENFRIEPLRDAQFVKTARVRYTQAGEEKSWEVVEAHDSVAVLIYHTQHDAFVLVKQFRPAVYLNNGNGETIELCAGIVDKELPEALIAREEIEEECGFLVPMEHIERVTSFYTSVGFAGSKQTLYYAEVDESMRIGPGGGVDGERIEVIELSVNEAERFIFDETIAKTPGLMFAFLWWKNLREKRANA
jgi:UDP-sugar diphosphatase